MIRVLWMAAVLFCGLRIAAAADQQSGGPEKALEGILTEIMTSARALDAAGGTRRTASVGQSESVTDTSLDLLKADRRFADGLTNAFAREEAAAQGESGGERGPRVFYGFAISALPNVVSILGNRTGMDSNRFICTGVLIDTDIVLTAAHCLCEGREPVDLRIVTFQLGAKGSPTTSIQIGAFGAAPKPGVRAEPPHFCPATKDNVYKVADLAVLKMASKAPCRTGDSGCIKPARLGEAEKLRATTAEGHYVVGYGLVHPWPATALREEEARPSERFAGKVIIASPDCAGAAAHTTDSRYYGCVSDREIVAGKFTGYRRTDACDGDSGGPLFLGDAGGLSTGATPDDPVVGIVSRGVTKECGSGTLYARVDERNRSWIKGCVSSLRVGKNCAPIH